MKHFFTFRPKTLLLLCTGTLLLIGGVQAQIKEQLLYLDSDREGIKERLVGTAFAEDFWEVDNKLVVLKYNSTKTAYSFSRGVLYQVDLIDDFAKNGEAEDMYKAYIEYIRVIGAIPTIFKNEGETKSVTAEKGDRIFFLYLEPKETGTISVSFSMQYADRSPEGQNLEMVMRGSKGQ